MTTCNIPGAAAPSEADAAKSTKRDAIAGPTLGKVATRTMVADTAAYDALRKRRRSEERKAKRGFAALRVKAEADLDSFDGENPKPRPLTPPPHALAARLLLASAVDSAPGLTEAVTQHAPVAVVVDVPDAMVLRSLQSWWADVIAPGAAVTSARNLSGGSTPPGGVVELFVHDAPKPARKLDNDHAIALALHFGAPTVGFSPDSRSHLPDVLVAAADHRLVVGGLTADVVRAVVETVTGRAYRGAIDDAICDGIGALDLTAAIAPELRPSDCIARLRRIAESRVRARDARDLRLSDVHGMDDAVAWSRSAIADVEAWRRSEVGWSSVDRACLLVGPPGTFKSSLAAVVANELRMPLVVGSFAKWQAAGHMGDFLAAMARDFDEIGRTGGVMMIDELDSFVVRGGSGAGTHERTYMAACVNGLLERTDGLASMEGVLLLAATNHADRIDPALLRAGRFSRVVHVGLPDANALGKILRVRLRADLPDVDLRPFAAQATGMTGSDIGRVVEDARRFARRDGVAMAAAHLWRALGDHDIPAAVRRRIAVHEAGHLLADVALQGPVGVLAVVTRRREAPGRVVRRDLRRDDEGTFTFFFDSIRIDLAGRAAEELLMGTVSDGAGSTNPESDLSRASATALHIVSTSGIAGPRPLLVLPDRALFPDRDVVAAADALLSSAAKSIQDLLLANRPALEEIARRLELEGSLDGAEAEAILCADRDGGASAVPSAEDPGRSRDARKGRGGV